jgi:hypothetical protein
VRNATISAVRLRCLLWTTLDSGRRPIETPASP